MSKLEEILQRNATHNIILDPFSWNNDLNGANIPDCLDFRLRKYEPMTILNTPIVPQRVGISPRRKGDVTNKNNGVNVTSGTLNEISDAFRAFI